jgi:hypothetical protein
MIEVVAVYANLIGVRKVLIISDDSIRKSGPSNLPATEISFQKSSLAPYLFVCDKDKPTEHGIDRQTTSSAKAGSLRRS